MGWSETHHRTRHTMGRVETQCGNHHWKGLRERGRRRERKREREKEGGRKERRGREGRGQACSKRGLIGAVGQLYIVKR